jgi:hypothetical protein
MRFLSRADCTRSGDLPKVWMDTAKMTKPNQVTAHNAGWRTQFRFAGSVFWSGVCEYRSATDSVS